MIKKPLLACEVDLPSIKYPVICSPKLDGIRCLIINGKALSRSFKPIPNNYVRKKLEREFEGCTTVFDGELILEGRQFNEISSAIMSEDGEPDFKYIRFDCVSGGLDVPYWLRLQSLRGEDVIATQSVNCEAELLKYEQHCLDLGYEGVMIRSVDGVYKEGRSTAKEQILMKLKRFADAEAVVVGFEEQMKNENELVANEAGKNLRSKKKENLVPKNTLGALVVRDVESGVEFKVSTGFSDELRKAVWENQGDFTGKLVKYKYQKHGTVVKPRSPVFVGFRSKLDT